MPLFSEAAGWVTGQWACGGGLSIKHNCTQQRQWQHARAHATPPDDIMDRIGGRPTAAVCVRVCGDVLVALGGGRLLRF